MKKTLIILSVFIGSFAFSQVIIGNGNITNASVSLAFGTGDKGLLLPWVTSAASVTGAVDGTVIYDSTDKKVKYHKAGAWFDLSVNDAGIVDTTLQNSLTEKTMAKSAIGINASTDTTPGILVLTDTNKAMILPKVASPHLKIINPAPGMIVYDTNKNQLAVYNGAVWSFWKP